MSDQQRVQRYGKAIWETSRADESTISVTGADIVARAVMAVADAEQAELQAELALFKRGGKTLGHTIEWQCKAALDATGLHHLIDEDGDGDWALVWEHLAELKPRAEAAEAKVARVEAALRLLDGEHITPQGASILRAVMAEAQS